MILLVDKPAGLTSHDVVARTRRLARTRKVGHAGTLDPMATGLLVLGIGPATRLLGFLTGADKDYDATLRLGMSTVTDDAEGDVLRVGDPARLESLSDSDIAAAVARWTGPIQQRPSAVSAIKVGGVRAHARVRAGEDVELVARAVTVSRFVVGPLRRGRTGDGAHIDIDASVTCSSGTYIRALARDIGSDLGVGGHLVALRRTRVGSFDLSAAKDLETLTELADRGPEMFAAAGLDMRAAVSACFPVLRVDESDAARVAHGIRLPWPAAAAGGEPDGPVGVLGPGDRVLALGYRLDQRLAYHVVFA